MAKAARQGGESAPLPAFGQLEGLAAFNGTTADAFMKASRAYWNALSELNGELYGFYDKRLKHDMDLSRTMAGCGDLQEATRLQQDWARTTLEEYAAEATKIMQLCSQAGMESWRTFYGQMGSGSKPAEAASETPEQRERAA